jgi:L-asparaginase / beta-aspartyl-peptidase
MPEPTIVVHGGAGRSVEDAAPYHAALAEALQAGASALPAGAVAAAIVAVERLEDSTLFNAGRGSVLTSEGRVEMDAAVMCGRTRRAGAVAAVTGVRHPIALAHAVMEHTPHVLLASEGAERLAAEVGLERVDPDWLVSDRQRERFLRRGGEEGSDGGTVGAVVLDSAGGLAAATSTGGRRGQLPGRVGDSPLIGAGTYADDRMAVSATGDGEQIVLAVATHELSALVRHAGLDLESACATVLSSVEGAGLIAIDADGNVATPFNTPAMHRGRLVGDGPIETAVGR